MPRPSGFALAVLLVASSACGRSKVTQCNALVAAMNGGAQAVSKIDNVSTDPKSAGAIRQIGEALEKAGQEVTKLELSVAELKGFRDQYVALSKDTAATARDMAAAAEAKDKDKITATSAALEKQVAAEQALVDNLNKFCQAP